MEFEVIDFSSFIGRDEALKQVIRYHPYKPMIYRTNLYIHSKRISWIVEELTPAILKVYPSFNILRARIMAQIHDDFELVLGDVQLGDKVNMSKQEKEDLHEQEINAIKEIASRFPKTIAGFNYQELLLAYQSITPDDLEASVVKFADKFDGFGEALHELFAGNKVFVQGCNTQVKNPTSIYIPILQEISTKLPLLVCINHPLLTPPKELDPQKIAGEGKLHSSDSVRKDSGYLHYEFWKKITLKHQPDLLTKIKEQ